MLRNKRQAGLTAEQPTSGPPLSHNLKTSASWCSLYNSTSNYKWSRHCHHHRPAHLAVADVPSSARHASVFGTRDSGWLVRSIQPEDPSYPSLRVDCKAAQLNSIIEHVGHSILITSSDAAPFYCISWLDAAVHY